METNTTEEASKVTRQTHTLIPSDRVEGTPVRRSTGEKIGTIQRLMIDRSAEMSPTPCSLRRLPWIGQKHMPIPWARLKYDLTGGAYVLDLTDEELSQAPSYEAGKEFDWGDRSNEIVIHRFHKVPHYWG